ncbi:NB-ARC domain protein [Dictyocaulus viviparus]|uniref:NB-ARC domain protein n=1 Tax=Dictyocaulus viviparus TaxID=29172 RepID=A0A0D8XX73_DICVI|nr:NB-ARC domain protein [Dictyocaulus viviparus]
MLSEPECRVLSSAFNTMLMDFDPKDAVIFLESCGLLTEHLAEKIEAKATRLERLRELLRIYRRRATDCEPLISYFEFAGQEHIANCLKSGLECIGQKYNINIPRFPHHLRLRKLLAGNVPRVWQHIKRECLMNNIAEILRKRADLDSFFVVLHGIAGCGKTSLAAAVFAVIPDILGNCFDSVIWLRDSSREPSQVRYLISDLLLMLWDDLSTDPPKLDGMSSVYLCKHVILNLNLSLQFFETCIQNFSFYKIREALVDRPNVIVVLDDIVQKETVKWASELKLRVLATTRNADLFASASCSVDIIIVPDLTAKESIDLFSIDCEGMEGDDNSIRSAYSSAFSVSGGNVALLGKLKKLAAGRADRLSMFCRRLTKRGLSSVAATTSYEFNSMSAALTVSIESLPTCDRDTLACAVMFPSGEDIPLVVWALLIPVDMADTDETEFMMLLSDRLCRLHNNGNWLSHNRQNDTFRINTMVEFYLRESLETETIEELESYVCNTVSFPTTAALALAW